MEKQHVWRGNALSMGGNLERESMDGPLLKNVPSCVISSVWVSPAATVTTLVPRNRRGATGCGTSRRAALTPGPARC